MKIRNEKDVELLDQKIQDELGIDVKKYRNPVVLESIMEIITLPQFIMTWMLRPLGISLLIFLTGFFTLNLDRFEYLLYGGIGSLLIIITGLLLGLVVLTWKIRNQLWGVIDFTLGIMKSAIVDFHHVGTQVTAENRAAVFSLLFKGIVHIVSIPMLTKAFTQEIPLVGGLFARFIKKVLTIVADKADWSGKMTKEELQKDIDQPNALELYVSSLTTVTNGLEKVLNVAFRIAQVPLFLNFLFFFILTLVFLYIIN